MKPWLAHAILAAGLAAATPIAAQPAATDAEAQSHILSAFITGADPRLLAEGVVVGPALREQLGAETDRRRIYDALIERSSGKPLRLRALAPGEVVRYASLPGVNVGEPLFRLEAGDLVLLLQYASRQKNVAFVEQLSEAAPPAATAAPKPAPIVEVPLPTVPPAAAPPPPPVTVEKPTPPAVVIETPKPPAVAVQKPAPPVRSEKPRPRGECVIKPVMSEEDLWNCSAPVRPAAVERPAPPVAVQQPQPAAPEPPKPAAECVIKPVMSEEDLRICAAVPTSRATAAAERPAPPVTVEKAQPSPPPALQPPPECVIKPVMSEEDLRICAAVPTSRAAAVERPAPPVAVQKVQPAAAEPPKPRPECVIKPVMSEEDLRICAAVQRPAVLERPVPPVAEKPQPSAPPAIQPPRTVECVIKPVMSDEELRACGVRR